MFDREKVGTTIKTAVDKAGTLVVAALTVASCALLVALAALLMVVKSRAS